jgi:thioredoxin
MEQTVPILTCPKCGAKNRIDDRAQQLQPVCGRCGTRLQLPASEAAADPGVPLNVTDASFAEQVLRVKGRPVLVDCWAAWCGPCRSIAPTIDRLAKKAEGRFVIAKLNTDQNPQTASKYRINAIPALLIFKDGQLVDKLEGVQPENVIYGRLVSQA